MHVFKIVSLGKHSCQFQYSRHFHSGLMFSHVYHGFAAELRFCASMCLHSGACIALAGESVEPRIVVREA